MNYRIHIKQIIPFSESCRGDYRVGVIALTLPVKLTPTAHCAGDLARPRPGASWHEGNGTRSHQGDKAINGPFLMKHEEMLTFQLSREMLSLSFVHQRSRALTWSVQLWSTA